MQENFRSLQKNLSTFSILDALLSLFVGYVLIFVVLVLINVVYEY